MARLPLTVQTIDRTGTTPTYETPQITASGGNSFPNSSNVMLHVKNAHATAPCTVSLTISKTVDGVQPAQKTVTVVAVTGDKMIGPFPAEFYSQPDGSVWFDITPVTDVVCAVIRVP